MLHAVNTQHGLQRIGPSAIARLGIKRLDDSVLDVNYLGRYASTTLAAFELFLS